MARQRKNSVDQFLRLSRSNQKTLKKEDPENSLVTELKAIFTQIYYKLEQGDCFNLIEEFRQLNLRFESKIESDHSLLDTAFEMSFTLLADKVLNFAAENKNDDLLTELAIFFEFFSVGNSQVWEHLLNLRYSNVIPLLIKKHIPRLVISCLNFMGGCAESMKTIPNIWQTNVLWHELHFLAFEGCGEQPARATANFFLKLIVECNDDLSEEQLHIAIQCFLKICEKISTKVKKCVEALQGIELCLQKTDQTRSKIMNFLALNVQFFNSLASVWKKGNFKPPAASKLALQIVFECTNGPATVTQSILDSQIPSALQSAILNLRGSSLEIAIAIILNLCVEFPFAVQKFSQTTVLEVLLTESVCRNSSRQLKALKLLNLMIDQSDCGMLLMCVIDYHLFDMIGHVLRHEIADQRRAAFELVCTLIARAQLVLDECSHTAFLTFARNAQIEQVLASMPRFKEDQLEAFMQCVQRSLEEKFDSLN